MNRKRRRVQFSEINQNQTNDRLQQLIADLQFQNQQDLDLSSQYDYSMEEENNSLFEKIQKLMNKPIVFATKSIHFQFKNTQQSIFEKIDQNRNCTSQQSLPLKKNKFQLEIGLSKQTISTPSMSNQLHNQQLTSETFSIMKIDSDDDPSPQISITHANYQYQKQNQYFYFDYLANKANFNERIELKKLFFIPYKRKKIELQYKMLEKIGEGSFGQVFKCQNLKTKAIRAVKIVKHQKLNLKYNRQILKRQIQILKLLDHPHIIKMYEIFQSQQIIYFVCEYCEGGTLKTYLKNKPLLTQNIQKKIMFQLLQAVNYMHSKNIIHRDLKPQNILFVNKLYQDCPVDIIDIRIIDFGLSIQYKGNVFKDWSKIGSLPYMAPQVFKGFYSNKSDSWSCGVIAHNLFLRHNPFHQQDTDLLQQKIRLYQLKQNKNWKNISFQQQQVLLNLLQHNYVMRSEITNVLNLKYFIQMKQRNSLSLQNINLINQNLLYFQRNKAIVDYIAYYLIFNTYSQQKIAQYRNLFNLVDQDSNGLIDQKEIRLFLFNEQSNIQSIDINDIQLCLVNQQQRHHETIAHNVLQNLNLDKSGLINFSQFLFALTNKKQLFTIQNINLVFSQIDASKDGFIDLFELKHFLVDGSRFKEEIVQNFMKKLTGIRNGKANNSQFLWYFLNHFYFGREQK